MTGAGLIWVGPSAAAIDAMGSKVGSKDLMRKAGVPTLPSITVAEDGALPDADEVDGLGWPLLVKASAGGGGRGMRVVTGPDGLAEALEGARREAASAFGDGTVFLERYVTDPRHIEVQVLADAQGGTVALFERECSIQRRHQKIIEEAPSPAVSPGLRQRLMAASTAAAEAVGYVNAGTVEFVVDRNGEPYFLEMNTRLQVEHPVTEAVTGLDLVRLQLLVAGGAPLPRQVHDVAGRGPVGHAVEARLYAEDPTAGWLPSTGTLARFEVPTGPDAPAVRLDSGVESGSVVSPHYDPMLAKVIAWAPTRHEAVSALAGALAASRIHGVTTNRDLLVRTLRHPGFAAGDTDTGFLDRHGLDVLAAPLADAAAVRRQAVAAGAGRPGGAPAARPGAAGGAVRLPQQPRLPPGDDRHGRRRRRCARHRHRRLPLRPVRGRPGGGGDRRHPVRPRGGVGRPGPGGPDRGRRHPSLPGRAGGRHRMGGRPRRRRPPSSSTSGSPSPAASCARARRWPRCPAAWCGWRWPPGTRSPPASSWWCSRR